MKNYINIEHGSNSQKKKKKKIQIENPRKHNLSKSMKDLNQFKKKFNDYNLEKIY